MVAKVLFTLIGLSIFAVGIWKLSNGVQDIEEATNSSTWPSVEGRITEARVIESLGGRHHDVPNYEPYVTYSYVVNGQTLRGSTITPGRIWSSRSAYGAVVAFPIGSFARIYHAPSTPSESTLVTGLHPFNFGTLAIGMTAFGMGSLFLLIGTRAKYVSSTSNQLDIARVPKALLIGSITLLFAGAAALILLSRI